jgi:hypothetical protein
MESKICNKCLLEKPILEFNKRSNAKDGFRYDCKSCQKLNYQNKREYYIGKMKENRINKLDDYTKRDKNYYEANRNEILKKKRQYHIDNQEILLKKAKDYYKNNKDKRSVYNKQWVKDNIIHYREYQKAYSKKYRENNPHIILWRSVLRCTLIRLGKSKEGHTIDLLGYSALELKQHLESLFTEGMSWDNQGTWHIDHIKPVSKFDPETPMNIVNALSNLQPLWGPDNIKKSDN